MKSITNLAQALAYWESFYNKNKELSPTMSQENNERYTRTLSEEELKVYEAKLATRSHSTQSNAATAIQKRWQKLRTSDALIPVNPDGYHTHRFHHLLNRQTVKKSLNKKKLELLLTSINNGDWDNAIFNDEYIAELALSLFASNKINESQINTILERIQTIKDYPLLATYRILDDQGDFTDEAHQFLLPNIFTLPAKAPLSKTQLESFRLLIATLPVSEQFFYLTELGVLGHSPHDKDQEHMRLGHVLMHSGAIIAITDPDIPITPDVKSSFYLGNRRYSHQLQSLVHLTSGARDALGLATFGLDDYVRPVLRLGIQRIADIEEGVRDNVRYSALSYPGTKAHADSIHTWNDITPLEATAHDIYHSLLMSTLSPNLRGALLYLVDLTRDISGHTWSRDIWDWIDAEFTFQTAFNLEGFNETDSFCYMLNYGSQSAGHELGSGGGLLKLKSFDETMSRGSTDDPKLWEVTPIGAIIFIDMVAHPEKWSEYNIDVKDMTNPFASFYREMKRIYPFLLNDSAKTRLLKYMLYQELKNTGNKDAMKFLFSCIDKIQNIDKHIQFKKITKKDKEINQTKLFLNSIYLAYSNENISIHTIADIFHAVSDEKSKPMISAILKDIIMGYLKNETSYESVATFLDTIKHADKYEMIRSGNNLQLGFQFNQEVSPITFDLICDFASQRLYELSPHHTHKK